MRKLLIATLVFGQALGQSAPAVAQAFATAQETQLGAFGGLRLSIPFGGARREPVRAGLAFAPTARTGTQDGRVRTRIGQGLEFGYRGERPMAFSLAGRDLSSFQLNAAQGEDRDRRRGGLSTGKAILIVGGVLVVAAGVGLLVFVDALNDASD